MATKEEWGHHTTNGLRQLSKRSFTTGSFGATSGARAFFDEETGRLFGVAALRGSFGQCIWSGRVAVPNEVLVIGNCHSDLRIVIACWMTFKKDLQFPMSEDGEV